jgi:hypothetical protein
MSRPSLIMSLSVVQFHGLGKNKQSHRKLKSMVILNKEGHVDYEYMAKSLSEELKSLADDQDSLKAFLKCFVEEGYENWKEGYDEYYSNETNSKGL